MLDMLSDLRRQRKARLSVNALKGFNSPPVSVLCQAIVNPLQSERAVSGPVKRPCSREGNLALLKISSPLNQPSHLRIAENDASQEHNNK
jgi:hypothetical protein